MTTLPVRPDLNGLPSLDPGLVAAYQVRHVGKAEISEIRSGETRGVALVANKHHSPICSIHLGQPVRSFRVKAPLQDVPIDDRRARQFAVSCPLNCCPDVHHQGARLDLGLELRWSHAGSDTCPRSAQNLIEGRHV